MLFMILRFTWKRTGVGEGDGTKGNCYHIMCYGIGEYLRRENDAVLPMLG